MPDNLVVFIFFYVAIAIAHFGFHLSLYQSMKMIEKRMKNAKSRRDPVYRYHEKHLKMSVIWPASLYVQLKDIIKDRK